MSAGTNRYSVEKIPNSNAHDVVVRTKIVENGIDCGEYFAFFCTTHNDVGGKRAALIAELLNKHDAGV